jgi:hypothetical protein
MNARTKEAIEVLARAVEIAKTGTITEMEIGFARAYLALALRETDPKRGAAEAKLALAVLGNRPDTARLVEELTKAFP